MDGDGQKQGRNTEDHILSKQQFVTSQYGFFLPANTENYIIKGIRKKAL